MRLPRAAQRGERGHALTLAAEPALTVASALAAGPASTAAAIRTSRPYSTADPPVLHRRPVRPSHPEEGLTMTTHADSPHLSQADGYAISPVQRNILRRLGGAALLPVEFTAHLDIDAVVTPDALRRAVLDTARCHDLLCSDYTQLPGMAEPAQVLRDRPAVEFTDADDADGADPADRGGSGDAEPLRVNEAFVLRPRLVAHTDRQVRLRLGLPGFLADAASLGRLARELAAALRPPAEAAAPTGAQHAPDGVDAEEYPRYADVAQFLADAAEDPDADAYWRGVAAEAAEGADAAVPAVGYEGSGPTELRFTLEPATRTALARAVEQHGWTYENIVLGAFQLLLHRLTGGRHPAVALAWPARTAYPELAGVFGPLTFDVPVVLPVAEGEGFAALQDRLARRLAQVDEHALAYPGLAERVMPEPPRFHADFTLAAAARGCGDGVRLRVEDTGAAAGAFDLALSWTDFDEGTCLVRFRGERYDRLDAELFFDRLQAVLLRVCADPDRDLALMPVMSDAESHRLVVEFNATERPVDGLPGVVEQFLEQARRRPDAVAVRTSTAALTYAELLDRARRLAGWLARQGVGRGDLVPLVLDRRPDALTAMVAVALGGAAYVPLNTALPPAKLTALVARTAPKALVTCRAWADRLERAGLPDTPALLVDRDLDTLPAAEPPTTENPAAGTGLLPRPDDPAYVIFTSGSTGEPKGVVVAHKRLANLVDWINRTQHVGPADSVLLVTSFSFDLSVYDVWGSLAAGATVRLADEAELADPQRLVDILRTEPVTVWDSAPAALQQLAPLLTACAGDLRSAALRLVMLSGDWIPVTLPDTVRGCFGAPVVLAMGGATEATVWSNYHVVDRVDPRWPSIPYGRPMQNCRYYVLDRHGSPQPTGVPGELYIGGLCTADGYFADSERTAERFLADPFVPGTSDRLYRTGDLVRHLGSGELQFLGREDDQVKIRGHRIELGEVAAAVRAHPAVQEAIVRSVREGDDNRLVAYWLPRTPDAALDHAALDHAALTAFLAGQLPGYAVPAHTVRLDRIPLTPNGKLDHSALPDHRVDSGRREEPATTTEAALLTIWQEILRHPDVGLTESFFAAGGHSLAAVQMLARVQTVFGRRVRMPQFVAGATVRELAALLDRPAGDPDAGSAPGSRPVLRRRSRGLPLSYGQRRMWFLHRLQGPSPTYNIHQKVVLHGPVDPGLLRAALADLVERHEILRTAYAETDGTPEQYVRPAAAAEPVLELVATGPGEIDAQVERAARYCFDLDTEIPLRTWLFTLAPDHHVLLVLTHHIAGDGISERVLLRDLGTAYAARAAGTVPDWAPLPVSYGDYVLWQEELLGPAEDPDSLLSRQLTSWRRVLDGAPPALALPYDRTHPPVPSHRGDRVTVTVDAGGHQALERLARRTESTLFTVLQAALAALLRRLGAGEDLPIGTGTAGRGDEALDDLIGFFVNTLVLRTDASGDPTFTELVRRSRACALEAFAHQDVPFDRVVEELAPRRSLARSPLFQVMLMLHNNVMPRLSLPGVRASVERVDAHTAKFDLLVDVYEKHAGPAGDDPAGRPVPDGLKIVLEYATDVFDEATVRQAGEHLLRILAAMADDPDGKILDVELLEESERRALTAPPRASFGADGAEAPTLVTLFEARVAAAPDAVAVTAEGCSLTYRELDRRANRLAHLLRGRGAGPERIVAVQLPRSADVVVALLGVLKAGAAYVPVDPAQPADRTALMLADADPVATVTEETLKESESCPDTAPDGAPAGPGHAAYVIYTSGSTGRPKGVVVPHANVVRLMRAAAQDIDFRPDDVWTLFHSYAFDFSVWEMWGALLHGGRLVVVPHDVARAPGEFLRLLADERVTMLSQTPSAFHQLAAADRDEPALGRRLALRYVVLGGEALEPARLADWYARHDASAPVLVNMYGITETTVHVTRIALDAATAAAMPGSVIGEPLPDLAVYVLDERLRSVPAGVPGELYVAGAGLARGYLNRPALTAERFVANPYGEPGSRLYRTGDLARRLRDGSLEYLGRSDDQVQLRGFRIELGEVGSALLAHPDVTQAAAVVREDRPGDRRLVGYVVGAADPAEVRRLAARRLPDHMLPGAVVVLDALPLTGNGKLDRAALPAPGATGTREGSRAPRGAAEETLCRIFGEVLGVAGVGVDDDFFALGGHSLLAARLIGRVRAELGGRPGIRDLFEAPTAAALAHRLVSRSAPHGPAEALSVLLPLRAAGSRPPLFCVHPAAGIGWTYSGLLRHLGPDIPLYALQSRALSDPTALGADLVWTAADYVRQIRSVQPSGPYHLLGWSYGGGAAHEMAVQLQAAGERVDLLAVLDGYPATGRPGESARRAYAPEDPEVLRELLDSIGIGIGTGVGTGIGTGPAAGAPTPEEFAAAVAGEGSPLEGLSPSAVAALPAVFARNSETAGAISGGTFQGELLFFLATEDRPAGRPDPLVWQRYVDGPVTVHEVPSTHGAMLQGHALDAIGPVLAGHLDRRHG
ncbi:amino acid adenylation domain-containing protein [Streptomyces bambusae]|uniref:Amino acid adenylation domain-containing protein n=1 Tax=Streptomyces bambusae TaxID=1550616 RepID=A0ABS6YYC1_9ACTN|nr:non-ribosomal peptide synthetase [Streptomyces bambusae]MBW5480457.1 amino acid adenylation domain-containing protein [Streptomyces bambusae]